MNAPPSFPAAALSPSELMALNAPPEFDGSRRKRLVKFLMVGLIAAAVVITWIVVSSQLPPPSTAPESAASAPPVEPPKPPPVETAATATDVVDPIKPAESTSAKPDTKQPKKGGRPGPGKVRPKADDLTIEIPDVPPDDSTPPPAP